MQHVREYLINNIDGLFKNPWSFQAASVKILSLRAIQALVSAAFLASCSPSFSLKPLSASTGPVAIVGVESGDTLSLKITVNNSSASEIKLNQNDIKDCGGEVGNFLFKDQLLQQEEDRYQSALEQLELRTHNLTTGFYLDYGHDLFSGEEMMDRAIERQRILSSFEYRYFKITRTHEANMQQIRSNAFDEMRVPPGQTLTKFLILAKENLVRDKRVCVDILDKRFEFVVLEN